MSGAARAGALSVLEECGDALAVYQRSLKRPSGPLPSRCKPVDLGFGDAKSVEAAFEMGNEEVVFHKLRRDCHWLEQLLLSTRTSLAANGSLSVLIEEISRKLAARSDEEEALRGARDAQEKLERVQRDAAEMRRSHAEEEERLKAELLKLRNEKEQLAVRSRAESEYSRAWLASRREQQEHRASRSRERLAEELQRCRTREERERTVTRRVEDFLRRGVQENERSAESWRERRRAETRTYEKEVHRLREEIARRQAALDELQNEYVRRQEFIDSCLAEKEAARRARELEAYVRGCAVRIQAWWRGVMVRRKLGPYRPEEKKRKRPVKPKK